MMQMQMDSPAVADVEEGFSPALRTFWKQFPDKSFFFALLAAWLLMFQFIGNSTFGYVDTASLFGWMTNAYNAKDAQGHAADDNFAYIIPVLVLGLMWFKRKELLNQPLRTWWPGILLVLVGLFFHVVGYILQQPRASVVGLFVGIYGLMGLTWGPQLLRAIFFPYFLFAFMVPFSSIITPLTFRLQLLVTKIVAFLCHDILGFSVVREGTQLINSISNYQYEVAAACGGIRSVMAIGVLAVVYAFTVFSRPWQRAVLLGCAVPFAVFGNAARLLIIVLSAERGGQAAGMAAHDSSMWSIVPYVPAIVGFLLVGRWMENRMSTRASNSTVREQPAFP